MKEYTLIYEVDDAKDTIEVPFDNKGAGRYSIKISDNKSDDRIYIILDRKACISFAELFAQLSKADLSESHHLHLNLSTFDPALTGGVFWAVTEDNELLQRYANK